MKSINSWLAVLFIFLVVMHDFLFLNLYKFFGSYFYLNLWKEVLFLAFFFVYFCFGVYSRRVGYAWLATVSVFIVMLFALGAFGDLSEGSLRTLRSFFMPLFVALIVSRLFSTVSSELVERVIHFIILIGVFSSAYGAYQFFAVKEMNDFWYVEPLLAQGFNIVEHNSFRDGAVRISGFFTSSLEFSFFTLFMLLILQGSNFARLQRYKLEGRWSGFSFSYYALLCVFVFSILFSTVRTAHIGLVVSLIYYGVVVSFRRLSAGHVFWLGLFLSSALVGLTFAYIYFGYTSDLSALGRLKQWSAVFNLAVNNPLGMGLGFVGPGQDNWYDSLILNVLSSMGFVAVVVFGFLVFFYYKVCVLYRFYFRSNNFVGVSLSLPVVAFFPVLIYLCFFQALYNAQVLYLFFIFLVSSFVGLKKHEV